MGHSRLNKSIKNARVNLAFYFAIMFVSFFSRDIFLKSLGDDFVGLASTLLNILALINVVELGVGSAVAYMLYKPILENDIKRINDIISVFGYIYRKIGFVVGLVALMVVPFLHLFFRDVDVSLSIIYFAYSSFVVSSLLGYFVNYKQLLLSADQRNYVITRYFQSANIGRLIVQSFIAYYTQNFYFWIVAEIAFSVAYSVLISRKVDQIYPFLKTDVKSGKELLKIYPELLVKIKQVFVHRLGNAVLNNLSPLILFSFTSAALIAHYTNYTLIMSKLAQLTAHIFSSIDAAVGSVIAEGKKEMIKRVYWEIISLYYLIAGVIVISLYFLVSPFISILFGAEYVMGHLTVIIILINFYFSITRVCNDVFIAAYGLFRDVWAPIVEAGLNISISIVGGKLFGINGVLIGSTIAVFLMVNVWRPYFLFRNGIGERISLYFITVLKHVILTVITFAVVFYISYNLTIDPANGYLWWFIYAVIIFSSTLAILYSLMMATSQGMRSASRRVINNLLKR